MELIQSFTEYAGRMPEPPIWIDNGAIVAIARPLEESESIVADLLDAGVEISGVWNQTWSGINRTFIGEQVLWNWEQGEYDHPNWDQWVDTLNAQDIQVLCYVNSMFLDVSEHEAIRIATCTQRVLRAIILYIMKRRGFNHSSHGF